MKTNIPVIPAILASLLIFLCAPAMSGEIKSMIDGSVYSAETNQPIKAAVIKLRGNNPKKPAAHVIAATDEAGRFQARLHPGVYRYTVSGSGFAVFEGTVSVAGKDPVKLSIPLNRESTVTGRIVDPSGKPLQGIIVSLGNELKSTTDGKGAFLIRGVDARGYDIRIEQPEWVTEKSAYVSVEAGEKKGLGDITIRKTGTLVIKMVAGTGGKRLVIDRAEIYLSGEPGYRSGRTNKKGEITLTGLAPGFYSLGSYDDRIIDPHMNVEVKEGERTSIKLEASLKPPLLSFDDADRIYLPSGPVKMRLTGLWIDRAKLTLYSVDIGRFRAGEVVADKPETIPLSFLAKENSFSVSLKREKRSHSKTATVRLPQLKPGIYLVEAASGKTSARALFFVTRLGIVAKNSPSGTLLYAVDLINGKALDGVEIKAFSQHPQKLIQADFRAETDANGLAEYGRPQQAVRIIGFRDGNPASLNLSPHPKDGGEGVVAGYLYTERPVYRPGQTVGFKGVVRKRVGDGYALPGLDRAHVTITDSGDQPVFEQDFAVNSHGSFNGEFKLPDSPPLGGYTLKAEAKQQNWQTSFKVLEYRKPEFEVTLTSARKFCVGGDTEELSLQARYYFGAPVAGAKVRYRIYSQPDYSSYRGNEEPADAGDGDEENDYSGGYSDFLGEGEVVSDEDGRVKIPVATKQTDIPLTYSIEADVTDLASRQVSASAKLLVTPSLVALDVRSHSFLAAPGKTVDFSAHARTWDDKPVKTAVSVAIEEQYFDKKTHMTSFRTVDHMDVSTDDTGRAEFRYSFPRPGYWRIAATAVDAMGRKTVANEWVWVWREGYAWDSSYRELGAEFDKKSYGPGENARLIVRNPAAGASVLLTIEGREVYARRVIGPAGTVEVVDIPVRKEYAPYVFVSTTVVANGRFYTRTKMLKVDYQANRLDVSVSSDKPVYAPGDTVHLSLATADSTGKTPRAAELSLAVVDEAIYAVSPERKDDIYRFFRGSREHLVTTLNSFPRVYLGGGAKDQTSGNLEQDRLKGLKVRKVFKDTASWMPVLETDAQGRTTAEFVLPDNLTTWRATAVGHTDDSDFGVGRGKFIARLDVMARLQPPRFFIQGDELKIPGVINNMTDRESDITGRFEAEGLALQKDGGFSGKVGAGGTLRRDIPVRAGNPGLSLLRLRAMAGDRGDAMELQVPVLPRAMNRECRGNIVLRGTSGETAVDFPVEALAEGSSLKVTIAPTLAASLNESLKSLVDFPYGCVEQTLSRFLPAVYVRGLIGTGGLSLENDIAEKLPKVLDEGLKKLYDFQHEDGGWGWWKEDASDPYMTAYVVYGLSLSRKAGIKVNDDALERGSKALQELVKKADVGSLPFAYRSLTLAGKTDTSVEKKIEAAWRQLPPSEKICYIDALVNSGKRERANGLLADLKTKVKREGSGAYLQDDDALSWWYSWRWSGSAVETTAMLLETVLASDPKDPLAPSLAEFLVRKRSGRWWNTTRGTAIVVKALADYVAATGESGASYTGRVMLNGRELDRIVVEKGKIVHGGAPLTIPASGLKRGANRVQLEKSASEGALYLTAVLDYLVPPEHAVQAQGLSVERKLYRIKAQRYGKEWRLEYIPVKPGENLAPGDDIEVRLIIDNKDDLNFVIIEDRLPAGFEVRETKTDARFAGLNEFWNWYVHAERHDERMAFFLDNLSSGRHEFRYVMYPELEGTALALPASVWPMYVPSLKSESRPWEVRVVR